MPRYVAELVHDDDDETEIKSQEFNVPEWPRFKDWDGNGRIEPKAFKRTVMRRAKAAVGVTGQKGTVERNGASDYVMYPRYGGWVLYVNCLG